ncbi:hypothetical protein, partial [Salmonella enterica]|uniref:hypothetical protein n=1 Tax=Salmonella enterica TaxID=28901 RepID=UPI0020C4A784
MALGFVSRGLIAAIGAMGLVLAAAPPSGAQSPAQPPVVLTLTGEEAPDTVNRMVEALSREGRQV